MAPPKTKKTIQLARMQPGTGNEVFNESIKLHLERTAHGLEVHDLQAGIMDFYPMHMIKVIRYISPTPAPEPKTGKNQSPGQEPLPS